MGNKPTQTRLWLLPLSALYWRLRRSLRQPCAQLAAWWGARSSRSDARSAMYMLALVGACAALAGGLRHLDTGAWSRFGSPPCLVPNAVVVADGVRFAFCAPPRGLPRRRVEKRVGRLLGAAIQPLRSGQRWTIRGSRVRAAPLTPQDRFTLGMRFDLNVADAATLSCVRGIGRALAHRIVDRRRRLGGFSSVSQVVQVRGVGRRIAARLAEQVFVGPSSLRRRSTLAPAAPP